MPISPHIESTLRHINIISPCSFQPLTLQFTSRSVNDNDDDGAIEALILAFMQTSPPYEELHFHLRLYIFGRGASRVFIG
jgi:hypothetical protein